MSLKIVYLDDEPDLCVIFRDIFSSEEVIIETYTESLKAIQGIKMDPPDLIFLDYRLPNITGDEVAMMLDKDIPKVLITGDINIKTDYSFLRIISKPFKIDEINELISSLVKQ